MFRTSKPRGLHFERFFDPTKPALSMASTNVVTAWDSSSVSSVVELMLNRFRRIPVVSGAGLSGIVGITDVLNFLSRNGPADTPVGRIKTGRVHAITSNSSVREALETFRKHGRGAYPITSKGEVVGMISERDFVERIDSPVDVAVSSIMTHKPMVAKREYTVLDAARMMCHGGFRRLPVTEKSTIVGIVTPYDILSYLNRKDASRLQKVGSVMNRFVTTIEPGATVSEAVELMKRKKLGGLPVAEEGELVGIITERDVLNALVV